MGFETVRNIAMSLIMLEFMQNKSAGPASSRTR